MQIETVTFYVTTMKIITCDWLSQIKYEVLTFLLAHLAALMMPFSFPVVSAWVALILVDEGCGAETVACSHHEELVRAL